MSNFKFLLSDPGFAAFADVAIAAENILHIDPAPTRPTTSRNTVTGGDKC